MKTIFLGDAARDSGSFGFSEAWPLGYLVSKNSTHEQLVVPLTILPTQRGRSYARQHRR
jgi:hypothetical protein